MMRLLVGALFLLAVSSQLAAQAAPAAANRPNIVFVLIDDAGFSDFGSYGSEIATPNIDQIASTGVRFANFHTASTCEATRVMLQSGVDISVIALWLGHESPATTHQYVEADLAMKERALARLHEPDAKLRRYRAPDSLIDFLRAL